jgi:hypothetical protein
LSTVIACHKQPFLTTSCSDLQQVASTDGALAGFLNACLSNPNLCALANLDTTQKSIPQQVYDLFDSLTTSGPMTLSETDGNSTIVDIKTLRTSVYGALYQPIIWPLLGSWLYSIYTDNATTYNTLLPALQVSTPPMSPFPEEARTETIAAIRCSDVLLRSKSVTPEPAAISLGMLNQSALLGSYVATTQSLLCPQWPFSAKEQYSGTFTNLTAPTKNPILFIGNVFDPITSLDAARNATATFAGADRKGSALLVQQGYGHASSAQKSNCTIGHMVNYFANGTVPEEGTICYPNEPLFDPAWATQLETTGSA